MRFNLRASQTKSTMVISHSEKIEAKKLLEPLIVNVFNLKKNKGGYRAKLDVFNLKKNEREKVRYKLAVYVSLWVLKCRSFNLHIYPR